MNPASYSRLLVPLAALVFVGGWILAVASYFVIGTETCAVVQVPIVGDLEACQDTSGTAVLLVIVVGFVATVSSALLLGMHMILTSLADSRSNKGG